jgi:hypothetical protein
MCNDAKDSTDPDPPGLGDVAKRRVAAETLGISRRGLYYRIERASLVELRDASGQVQADAEMQLAESRKEAVRSLLATEARVTGLTLLVDTLCRENEAITREWATLAREHEA